MRRPWVSAVAMLCAIALAARVAHAITMTCQNLKCNECEKHCFYDYDVDGYYCEDKSDRGQPYCCVYERRTHYECDGDPLTLCVCAEFMGAFPVECRFVGQYPCP